MAKIATMIMLSAAVALSGLAHAGGDYGRGYGGYERDSRDRQERRASRAFDVQAPKAPAAPAPPPIPTLDSGYGGMGAGYAPLRAHNRDSATRAGGDGVESKRGYGMGNVPSAPRLPQFGGGYGPGGMMGPEPPAIPQPPRIGMPYGAPGMGYGAPGMGYGAPGMGYGAPGMGYGRPGMGYGRPGMGYGRPGMGYGRPGMGVGRPGMGYPMGRGMMPRYGMQGTPQQPFTMGDIVVMAEQSKQFNTLLTAVDQAGLVETLKGDGPFTVFAPTDKAFEKVPEDTLNALLDDQEALKEVLTFHVVPGNFLARQVVNKESLETVQGDALSVEVNDGEVKINGARVTVTDIVTTNGVIHVIDSVLLPEGLEIQPTQKAEPEGDSTEA